MKILRINNHKAEYSIDGVEYNSIVNINKEILKLFVDNIMTSDDITFDKEEEDNKIENKAESIIYNDVYKKLNDLIEKKHEIIDKVDSTFSILIEKYELEK